MLTSRNGRSKSYPPAGCGQDPYPPELQRRLVSLSLEPVAREPRSSLLIVAVILGAAAIALAVGILR